MFELTVPDLYMCQCHLVYPMYLTEEPTIRHTGRQWCNGRITQTHLLKLNGRVPGTSLGSSFQRDLLYMAAMASEKGMGIHFTWVFIPGKYLVNDMSDGPHHLSDILYDAFYVTAHKHQYVVYCCRPVGKNHIRDEMVAE